MKRILKILIIFFSAIIVFGVGFILTLQIFEYRPKEVTELSVSGRFIENSEANYVPLNTQIKIVTFNTGYASLSQTEDFVMDGGSKSRMDTKAEVVANYEGIASSLASQNADIYLLQEVDTDSHRSYDTDQYGYYQEVFDRASVFAYNYRCIFVPFPLSFTEMMGNVNSGITTFSDYYIDNAKRIQLPGSFSWPTRLAQLKRCILISRLPIQGSESEMVLINVHLSAYDDGSMRAQEMEALKDIMQTEYQAGNYVVVGGDFNQTFPQAVTIHNDGSNETYDYLYELKDADNYQAFPMEEDWFLENNFQFGVDVSVPTCRLLNHPYDTVNKDNNQYYVIDGYIVSDNVTINDVETLDYDFLNSDHNPVAIELTLTN